MAARVRHSHATPNIAGSRTFGIMQHTLVEVGGNARHFGEFC